MSLYLLEIAIYVFLSVLASVAPVAYFVISKQKIIFSRLTANSIIWAGWSVFFYVLINVFIDRFVDSDNFYTCLFQSYFAYFMMTPIMVIVQKRLLRLPRLRNIAIIVLNATLLFAAQFIVTDTFFVLLSHSRFGFRRYFWF